MNPRRRQCAWNEFPVVAGWLAGRRQLSGDAAVTNDWMLGSLYLLMAIMLVAGSLISRREKFARTATMALAWITIFGAGFVLFTFRDDLGYVAQRLRSEATGEPVVEGHEVRIPMAIDGHFWVEGSLNGRRIKFLVDSGATMTTIGRDTAEAAAVAISPDRSQIVRTGNAYCASRPGVPTCWPSDRSNAAMSAAYRRP